jgi:crotonobetainyl-CoA:carnitine CoA-transferase CaiB-like acyl-CoA transferase
MLMSTAQLLAYDMCLYDGRPDTLTADSELYGYDARYRLYEAADGWIYLAAPAASEWDHLVAALEADVDLTVDPRFTDEAARRAYDHDLAAVLSKVFLSKPAQHWEDLLLKHDVGCVVAHAEPPEAVLQTEEFGRASDLLVEVEHPTFGEHDRLATLVDYSRSETIAEPGVLNGQHTDAILTELGYTSEQIADLRARSIVG